MILEFFFENIFEYPSWSASCLARTVLTCLRFSKSDLLPQIIISGVSQ